MNEDTANISMTYRKEEGWNYYMTEMLDIKLLILLNITSRGIFC